MILYNEIEPYPAQWLRNLIAAGHLPAGRVDETDMRDLEADDLPETFHAFAGIGGWPLALKMAGWPDDAPVWTGSCPCQPFSTAGRRKGFDDERHLWPYWHAAIRYHRPAIVFGEQVASPDGRRWFSLVRSEMEALGYSVGGADLCAAGVGAPHIRQRLWFVAIADGERREGLRVHLRERGSQSAMLEAPRCRTVGVVGNTTEKGRGRSRSTSQEEFPAPLSRKFGRSSATGVMGNTGSPGFSGRQEQPGDGTGQPTAERAGCSIGIMGNTGGERSRRDTGAVSGAEEESGSCGKTARDLSYEPVVAGASLDPWREAEWLACSDGKARAVEPGSFPLAYGVPNRVGKLRAYGNAIVPQAGAIFIRAVIEHLTGRV